MPRLLLPTVGGCTAYFGLALIESRDAFHEATGKATLRRLVREV